MVGNALSLLTSRRFLPLFLAQFLGAFNDNLYKMAMIMLITFRLASETGMSEAILTNMAAGLFILPFFIASYMAGQLADKFEKSMQIRWIKTWEVGLMCIGAYGFYSENIVLMMAILFGMGLQSTFFGPIKYGILPQTLDGKELIAGNGLIEAATFLSILLGSSAGGLLILTEDGTFWTSIATISCALVGLGISFFIPATKRPAPDLEIKFNAVKSTVEQVKSAKANKTVFLSILGISWMWLYGSLFLAQIPALVKVNLGGDEQAVTLLLVTFSVGVGIGSLACVRMLKGQITARLVKPALLSVTLAGCTLGLLTFILSDGVATQTLSLEAFLATPIAIPLIIVMLWHTISTGIFVVPLYAMMQHHSDPDKCSRMVAANNVINSGFMVFGAVFALSILLMGGNIISILVIVSLANLIILPYLKPLFTRTEDK